MKFLPALMLILLVLPAAAQDAPAEAQRSLHRAAARGDAFGVARALDQGAAVDAPNERGETALLLAVAGGHTRVAEVLIARDANINAVAANRDTPWLLAGAEGRTAILQMMLPKGPDYKLRNRYGGSALIPACHHGHVETVRFLTSKSKVDIDHVNSLGWTCLLEAILLGDGGPSYQAIVRIALAAGASPSLADKDGTTPLRHARARGQTAIAELIAAAGGK